MTVLSVEAEGSQISDKLSHLHWKLPMVAEVKNIGSQFPDAAYGGWNMLPAIESEPCGTTIIAVISYKRGVIKTKAGVQCFERGICK